MHAIPLNWYTLTLNQYTHNFVFFFWGNTILCYEKNKKSLWALEVYRAIVCSYFRCKNKWSSLHQNKWITLNIGILMKICKTGSISLFFKHIQKWIVYRNYTLYFNQFYYIFFTLTNNISFITENSLFEHIKTSNARYSTSCSQVKN